MSAVICTRNGDCMRRGNVFKRNAGILMAISSLPSPYGIGTLGKEA